ncbi:MAG: VWA domain-containing protein [Deltaproteobacteria bacterium]|nr:VWA domain-containing protein [Deltaproteobacteria bacterium]
MKLAATAALAAVLLLPALAHAASPELVVPSDGAKKDRPRIEVTFVLDTTGSMSGLIEGAKQKIWSIASKIAQGKPSPDLRVGLVGYRDRGDDYVTKKFDLTDNLDRVFENLQGFSAQGGGDTPEHVGQALGEAVKDFSWSSDKKVLKMIFVVGDAPPQVYQDGWDYRDWAKKAIAQGIMVNTIRCGGYAPTETAFREIANLADGQYVSIDAGGGMIAVTTPYDAEMAKLTGELEGTAVYTGTAAARGRAEAAKAAVESMGDGAAADRAAYMTAKGGAAPAATTASTGARDIVAAEPEAVAALDKDELPDDMRKMDSKERVAHVKALQKKREAVQKQIAEVAKKRDAWLKSHAAEKEDSFDGAVMKEVRTKAARIGVMY